MADTTASPWSPLRQRFFTLQAKSGRGQDQFLDKLQVTQTNADAGVLHWPCPLSDLYTELSYTGHAHLITGSTSAFRLYLYFGHHATQRFSIKHAFQRTGIPPRLVQASEDLSMQHAKRDPDLWTLRGHDTSPLKWRKTSWAAPRLQSLKSIHFQHAESRTAVARDWEQRFTRIHAITWPITALRRTPQMGVPTQFYG